MPLSAHPFVPSSLSPFVSPKANVACSNKYVSWSHAHPHSQPKNMDACDLRDLRLTNVSPIFLK